MEGRVLLDVMLPVLDGFEVFAARTALVNALLAAARTSGG
jgi:hypothetical protein